MITQNLVGSFSVVLYRLITWMQTKNCLGCGNADTENKLVERKAAVS